MTTAELKQDIQTLKDFPTNQEKKELAQKYEINSMKSKEIISKIETILLDTIEGKSSDEFLVAWIRHYDHPLSVAKVRTIITDKTNPAIIQNLRNYYKGFQKTRPRSNYIAAYNSIAKYLSELLNNPNKENDIQQMTDKLIEITEEFNNKLLVAALEEASHYYSEIQQLNSYNLGVNDFKSLFGVVKSKERYGERPYKSEIPSLKFNGYKFSAKEINSYCHMNSVAKQLNTDCCLLKKKTLEEYLEKAAKDFTTWYQAQMQKVAAELMKKGLANLNSLRILAIDKDKKGFYSIITDGNVTVKTRAIPCCANSSLISFHYRFISTIIK